MMPLLTVLIGYAIDFAYFFFVAASITSAARNAAEYSIQGFTSPAQAALPATGPVATTSSVASTVIGDLAGLVNASTLTAIQICSKSLGVTNNVANCANYGISGPAYTPGVDAEAPNFVMQRVDVTYTVQPPVPLSLFGVSLLPQLQFHRQVSMRALD